MLRGDLDDPKDPELVTLRTQARARCVQLDAITEDEGACRPWRIHVG